MDIRNQMPVSQAWTLLQKENKITDLLDDFYVLYKKGDQNESYFFAGLYQGENEYNQDYIAIPVSSSYEGTTFWKKGTLFSNILGSAGDGSRIYYNEKLHTWKELSKALGIEWKCMAEKDTFYDTATQKAYQPTTLLEHEKYSCNTYDSVGKLVETNVIGGHVIQGRNPTSMPQDSNVYIVPICKHHNSINLPHKNTLGQNVTPGNGNGFYMSIGEDTTVIKLKGYLKPSQK